MFRDIDRLLRGELTRSEDLKRGQIAISTRALVIAGFGLGAIYGACMGLYAVASPETPRGAQLVASMVKVPLLFLLTLFVTFPSLYVFSALSNTRLLAKQTLRLILCAITVNLALLASFGPITAFFTFSTESYPFMVLLNVLFFTISGVVGLRFAREALARMFEAKEDPPAARADAEREADRVGPQPPPPPPPSQTSPIRRPTPADPAQSVFKIWALIYGVVGAQMGWILRPFVGSPELPFEWFRDRSSNFFEAVVVTLRNLFS